MPEEDYVNFAMEQRYPKAWNLSLDVAPDEEGSGEDKSYCSIKLLNLN